MSEEMKNYIGTKEIKARPMTLGEYNKYRGWDIPSDEDPEKEVYLVEYAVDPDSKPNHADHEGYITMSPKHLFDKEYKPSDTFLDRLLIERDELSSKISKLDAALEGKKVPADSITILEIQVSQMSHYLGTLEERIEMSNK